ncbi:hypothetical protein XspCFBP7912_13110 [Xanthomonas sp. CFBP 7912]|nr:hypothetical protein XspCFBP7912_13110 [Xanthomonas sp. CFBP 7912]
MMKSDCELSLDRLQELLSYDPVTGELIWLIDRNNRSKAGAVAGRIHPSGYRMIEIDGKAYSAHRVAFALHNGRLIEDGLEIDHRDGNRSNNAACNLREVTCSGNCQNRKMRSDNRSGYTGVSWHSQAQKWWAQITHNGKKMSLGLYETAESASRAYLDAKRELHSFQPEPRK